MKPSSEQARPQVHERLRRLLFLVPFVSRNQGLSVEEVARAAGMSREALLEDLDLLTLVGRPPFQPDDFIDIYVEDGCVYVDLDQRFMAPPRLTAGEGAALAAAAALLKPAAGEELSSALAKLERVLPPQAVERYRSMGRAIDVSLDAPEGLKALAQAISDKCEVEFDYFTSSRAQTERRTIRPSEISSHRGQWYVSGFCLTRNEERLFRLDRITDVKVTTRRFEDPKRVPEKKSSARGDAQTQVVVRFDAVAAASIVERFGDGARQVPGGCVEVTVPGDSEHWLTQWILSFGGSAVVQSPPWAREAVAAAAAAALLQVSLAPRSQ